MAVDHKGEAYSVSRYVGIKAKDIRARLGDSKDNPSLEKAESRAKQQITDRLKELEAEQQREFESKRQQALDEKERQDAEHRRTRERLNQHQAEQAQQQADEHASRFRHGVFGFWDRLTGRRKKTETQNSLEARQAQEQRQKETDDLTRLQALEDLQRREEAKAKRRNNVEAVQELRSDIKEFSRAAERARRLSIREQRLKNSHKQRQRNRDGPSYER